MKSVLMVKFMNAQFLGSQCQKVIKTELKSSHRVAAGIHINGLAGHA